ncbi:Glycosyl transferase family 2 [Aquisphaera giovannonii]|uniref:Glycosyl transferase family 2 n=1 Tax=Aquisphaera giovannonii TaxID=406548 RepID=A0A5B9W6U2_9BACT|nr:glycosyltransferase [Aquisphaera giovannonii]QEH36382.1 Glycosyl transferase family 2 [Aquisphaera giovannonii]
MTVVICTHNARPDWLRRVVDSIREQTLPRDRWELLVVDNHSARPILEEVDLSWHPAARGIEEGRLGLTNARLRAISESRGDILVFVDDDNVLDPNYLEEASRIAARWPQIGAWSGRVDPEYEAEVPPWCRRYVRHLAIRVPEHEAWTNVFDVEAATPYGAGMCVRRSVALAYLEAVESEPLHRSLDRVGDELMGCGDIDIGMKCYSMGLGTGVFPELRLTHLIPAGRLTEEYMCRLAEGNGYSRTLMLHIHGLWPPEGLDFRLLARLRWLAALRLARPHRRIVHSLIRGQLRAARDIEAAARAAVRRPDGPVTRHSSPPLDGCTSLQMPQPGKKR